MISDIEHMAALKVTHSGHIFVSTLKRLFVHPDVCYAFLFATFQSTLYGTLHNAICLIPREGHPASDGRAARFQHPVNR
jgi:hypothetical protein